jgi:hypothetical protein
LARRITSPRGIASKIVLAGEPLLSMGGVYGVCGVKEDVCIWGLTGDSTGMFRALRRNLLNFTTSLANV